MFRQLKELSFPAIHQDKLYIGEQIIYLKTLDFRPRVTWAILPICHVKSLTLLSLAYAVMFLTTKGTKDTKGFRCLNLVFFVSLAVDDL